MLEQVFSGHLGSVTGRDKSLTGQFPALDMKGGEGEASGLSLEVAATIGKQQLYTFVATECACLFWVRSKTNFLVSSQEPLLVTVKRRKRA